MGYGDQAQAVLGAAIQELSGRKQLRRQTSPGDHSAAFSGDKSSLADDASASLERQNDEMLMRILYNNLKLKTSSRRHASKRRRGSRYNMPRAMQARNSTRNADVAEK